MPLQLDSILDEIHDMWIRVDDRLMCVPPKCGTLSFRLAVMPEFIQNRRRVGYRFMEAAEERGIGMFSPEVAKGMGLPMFQSVRHPVDRFCSLWKDLQRSNVHAMRVIKGIEPEALMDIIEAHPAGNDHWRRQSSHYIDGVDLVPYDQFLDRMGLPFFWEHRSGKTVREMPEQRILRHYGDDLDLWQHAVAS